jgi:ribosomal protein L40E
MIVCRSCGHENADGADFCASCGTFLEWTGEKVGEAKPTPPRPTSRPAPQPGGKPAVSSSSAPRPQAKPATPAATSKPSTAAAGAGTGAKPAEPAATAAAGTTRPSEPAVASSHNSEAAAAAKAPEQSEEDRKKAEAEARARALVTRPTATTPASRAAQPARPAASAPSDGARQPTAQRPVAQKPGAAKTRVAPKPPQAKGREYKPGDKICGQCGEGNDPARKFCRKCGTSLVEAVVAAEPSWWKRLFSKKKKTLKAGERRTRADGTLKDGRPRVFQGLKKTFNVLFAILAILLMFAFIGPWRGSVLDAMRDTTNKVKRIFIAEYEPLHADGIEATSSLPEHPAAMAIDGATNFAWQEGAPGDGEGQKLVLTFNQQVDIDKIGIRSGASNQQEEFLAQPRPRELHIVFSNGAQKDITLKDTPEFQTFNVKAHAIVRMEITVTSVITSFKGGHDMGIAEVELFTRK